MYRRRQQGQMFHHGRIAIENIVIGKVDELIVFVENRYPKNILAVSLIWEALQIIGFGS